MTSVLSFIAGERQDAVSADFRRYYGTELNHAVTSWTGADLSSALRNLPPDSATVRAELGDLWDWNHMAANIAELVDLMSYWLHSEYSKSIYDPEDPANKEAQKRRPKPPPTPIIPPVAYRPASVAEQRMNEFIEQASKYSGDPNDTGPKWVTSDEFDTIIDLI